MSQIVYSGRFVDIDDSSPNMVTAGLWDNLDFGIYFGTKPYREEEQKQPKTAGIDNMWTWIAIIAVIIVVVLLLRR